MFTAILARAYHRKKDEIKEKPLVDNVRLSEYNLSFYNLDPVGSTICQAIDGKNTVAQIRDRVTQAMDVSSEQAQKDLVELLEDLRSVGAV